MTSDIINVDYREKIPNNVNLTEDRRVLKALEGWHPGYINWWNDMGPEGFQEALVYLRTAVSVDPKGWAKFDYVKMPDYRWGILLAPSEDDRTIPFGEHFGEPYCHQGNMLDPEFGWGRSCREFTPPIALTGPHSAGSLRDAAPGTGRTSSVATSSPFS